MKRVEEFLEGLELKYTGSAFAGFIEDNPFVTFLGYDSNGWSHIWVKYCGKPIYMSVHDVELSYPAV
ncbi:hypothetical protein DJ568_15780 [Mucilaginibacter hurinus]|uniref:Uncharacterized protein n=1 Tax=Mucilaginibacter hurinus TaxID=2201324 RepID=A0A367GL58_9SPHI|nr:hypothetical protein [Mucilaginibacter hurinus]RCH53698.1 hypothetical protein DJ568_15780 [Mucilaginibacter hurinus]